MENLVGCLEHWAERQPDKVLYRFVDGRGHTRDQYTYESFLERTSTLGQQLIEEAGLQNGDRALLVYPPGLESLAAFFACQHVGVIPVPVSTPTSMATEGRTRRIEHVALDCSARIALTSSAYLQGLPTASGGHARGVRTAGFLESVTWYATDAFPETGRRPGRRQVNPVLFLQYTSGSTGEPKGVIVTHRNVMHNARASVDPLPVGVSWLPQFHDMGLIGHYLYMVVLGGTNHGFSSFDFLKRPALWLQMMSSVRATMTAAPNFAYGYCLREDKVPDSSLSGIDLSSIKRILNAAEPIHPETYARFSDRFSRYGLASDACEGGYGLAENTLAVSLHGRHTLRVQKDRLQRRQLSIQKSTVQNNNQISLYSCGQPLAGVDVQIVDPESRISLGPNAIGEIWIDGESKCAGYWQRPELSRAVFEAQIANQTANAPTYLRTGDLGFLHEGELYVCGRIKDLIIIRGTNYYPQDIEDIVETGFPDISPVGQGRTVAFSHEHNGEERLVVVIEVRRQDRLPDPAEVAQAIRSRYFVDPYQVLFVSPCSISKTTSGKVSRSRTKERWLDGELEVLASYLHAENESSFARGGLRGSYERIRALYRLQGDEEVTLTDVGLDSLTLVELTLDIQHEFELRGLGDMVADLDARFLQRLTVAELSRLLDAYESSIGPSVGELRVWLEARQRADDANELALMRKDCEWQPPSDCAEDPVEHPRAIFLTGASGFFGPFLLASFLQRTPCEIEVLVRAANPAHGHARLVEAMRRARVWTPEVREHFCARVRVVCGDLGHSQFGLSDREWQRLETGIDAIVHNGAQVNYVLSYEALRPFNVEATRQLLRLAATGRKKPFHLISTTFIHGWSARPVAAEHHYNENLEDLDFGYAQSKCVAEHLVRNAELHGQPIRIYRPTLITASSNGLGNKDDIFVRMLAFMVKYGLAPEVLNQTSLLPADLVADHIARIFLLKDTSANTLQITTSKFFNIMDVTRIMSERYGYSFRYCSTPRFVEEMNRLCTPDDLLYPLLVFFNRSQHKFKPMEHKRYDNRHYQAALGLVTPEALEPEPSETVAYIVQHMQREGLIPTPCLV